MPGAAPGRGPDTLRLGVDDEVVAVVRRRRVVTRRDRDLRLGYAGLLVGAGAFVGALVVTTTVVDVLPELGGEGPVLAAEQPVVTGAQLRPATNRAPRPAPRATDPVALAPAGTPTATTTQPTSQSATLPVAQQPPPPAPQEPQEPRNPQGPSTPGTPPPASPPGTQPGGGGDGPVSAVLNPIAGTAAQTLEGLTGGLSQPVGQGVVGVVGALGQIADGPLGGQAKASPGRGPRFEVPRGKGPRGKGPRGKGARLSAGRPWR